MTRTRPSIVQCAISGRDPTTRIRQSDPLRVPVDANVSLARGSAASARQRGTGRCQFHWKDEQPDRLLNQVAEMRPQSACGRLHEDVTDTCRPMQHIAPFGQGRSLDMIKAHIVLVASRVTSAPGHDWAAFELTYLFAP